MEAIDPDSLFDQGIAVAFIIALLVGNVAQYVYAERRQNKQQQQTAEFFSAQTKQVQWQTEVGNLLARIEKKLDDVLSEARDLRSEIKVLDAKSNSRD